MPADEKGKGTDYGGATTTTRMLYGSDEITDYTLNYNAGHIDIDYPIDEVLELPSVSFSVSDGLFLVLFSSSLR